MTKAPTWMMNQSHFTSDTTEMAPRKADPTQARSAPMAPAMSSVGAPERMPTAQETRGQQSQHRGSSSFFLCSIGQHRHFDGGLTGRGRTHGAGW